jgi:hypothetical protein
MNGMNDPWQDPWQDFRFRNRLGCLLYLASPLLFLLFVPPADMLLGKTAAYVVVACCFAAAMFGMFYRSTARCPRCNKPFYSGRIGFLAVHNGFAWKCMNCGIPKYLAFVPEEQEASSDEAG